MFEGSSQDLKQERRRIECEITASFEILLREVTRSAHGARNRYHSNVDEQGDEQGEPTLPEEVPTSILIKQHCDKGNCVSHCKT